MMGKTGDRIKVIRPLADGVIADFVAGEEMVKAFIRSASVPKYRIGKVVMGVPTGITEVEKLAVIESAEQAGAREVYLIAEPMAMTRPPLWIHSFKGSFSFSLQL